MMTKLVLPLLFAVAFTGCFRDDTSSRPNAQPRRGIVFAAKMTDRQREIVNRIRDLDLDVFDGTTTGRVEAVGNDGEVIHFIEVESKRDSRRVPFSLIWDGEEITGKHITLAQSLATVECFSLTGTAITDSELKTVGSMGALKVLYINDTAVTDSGIEHLRNLKNLEVLGFADTAVTDDGIVHLQQMESLKSLSLADLKLTDAGIRELLANKQLQILFLNGTQVTDNCVDDLSKLVNLRAVDFHNTRITERGIERLKLALPNCKFRPPTPPSPQSPPAHHPVSSQPPSAASASPLSSPAKQ